MTLTVVELATRNCKNMCSSSMSLCPEVVTGEQQCGVHSTLQVKLVWLTRVDMLQLNWRLACAPGSVAGTATGYGLDGPRIESRWGRDFPHLSRPALGPTQPPVQWIPGLSGVKSGRGMTLTPCPLLVPWSWKGRSIPLLAIEGVFINKQNFAINNWLLFYVYG